MSDEHRRGEATIIEHESTVCGSPVDPTIPTYTAEHDGRTLFFCAADCIAAFEKDPVEFLRTHH